ncbi:MAG: lipopolysaccharide transport periplasmic protein LptA [Gammaproteobacteria bacterium]|nr:lipopolysaccharide transport periplasmic protein LptA [Gammaproteobacteria bacterium]
MKTTSPVLIIIYLVILLPSQLLAATTDKNQPIEVEADSLEIRDNDNISIYSGNVRLQQGSLLIGADRLVIHFNKTKDLELMEMTGNPATFRQLNDKDREMLGEAEKLDYHEPKSLLVLEGNARFSSNGDTIESSTIRINTETDKIEASSTKPEERVRMTIQPKSQDEDNQ